MGQPKVASATWHGQNRRISRDFYEAPGQQTWQTAAAVAAQVRCHVNTLNCVLREAVKLSLKIEGNVQTLPLMGWLCIQFSDVAVPEPTPMALLLVAGLLLG